MLACESMDGMPLVDAYPLSPIQAGMLFHHLQGGQPGVDIEQMIGAMAEHLDADSMLRAWSAVCQRHDILRTSFRWDGLAAGRYALRALDGGVESALRATLADGDRIDRDVDLGEGRVTGSIRTAAGEPPRLR